MLRIIAVVAALAAVACGNKTPDAAELAACADRASALGAKLESQREVLPQLSTAGQTLPVSTRGAALEERGSLVVIVGNSVNYDTETYELSSGQLRRHHQRRQPPAEPVYIQVAPATEVYRLTSVLKQLEGDRALRLLVRLAEPRPPGPMAAAPERVRSVLEETRALAPGDRATMLAEKLELAIGSCKPIEALFSSLATRLPADKTAEVVGKTADSLRACDCKVADLDMFEYLLLSLFDAGPIQERFISLAPGKTAVEVPLTATVADLVAAIDRLPASAVAEGIDVRLAN